MKQRSSWYFPCCHGNKLSQNFTSLVRKKKFTKFRCNSFIGINRLPLTVPMVTMPPWQPTIATKFVEVLITVEKKILPCLPSAGQKITFLYTSTFVAMEAVFPLGTKFAYESS